MSLSTASSEDEDGTNVRWSRVAGSADFFHDAERLRLIFWMLAGSTGTLLVALALGLWRLQRAAAAPPVFVGISHRLIFSGPAQPLSEVTEADFDRQLVDTIEVAFSRTEKGLPPALGDFAAPGVLADIDRAYRDTGAKYPAGYVQTMTVLDSKVVEARRGHRRMRYRSLLSSRSIASAQTSALFLDATFEIGPPTSRNAVGWRLVQVDAIAREDYFADERERRRRDALDLGSPERRDRAP